MAKRRIPIKSAREIEAIRRSSGIVREVLDALSAMCVPGLATREIDQACGDLIEARGGRSAFLGYRGFPGNCCISVNEEVVHGIGGQRRLQYGDIVKLDVGVMMEGWIGDSAVTVPVGLVAPPVQRLLDVTEDALRLAIDQARPGNRVGDICHAVESLVTRKGYSVVREFVGHGVGRRLHEEPQIPNYGSPGSGPELRPGMVLAIEPMVNEGRPEITYREDKWTVATADGSLSAHFEHTVVVTEGDPEILTCRERTISK